MKTTRNVVRLPFIMAAVLIAVFAIFACVPTPPTPGGCNGGSSSSGSSSSSSGSLDVFREGPYAATVDMNSGAAGRSGVFYPSDIASLNETFPVLVFGCGAGTGPQQYRDHGLMIASHGYICIINASDNQGRMNTQALNWITQQNTRPGKFQGKVNTNKMAAGGHSQGSIGTFAMADDPRLTTTIHVAGGSFTGTGPNSLRHPTIYISGTGDMALPQCQADYRVTTVPVFFTVMQGVDHIMATREGMPAIIAWLNWFLKDQTQYRAEFLSPGGAFIGGKWDSQSKNW